MGDPDVAKLEPSSIEQLSSEPVALATLSDNEQIVLEEYKLIVAERRFVMERYIQGLVIYSVVMGYSFKELLIAPTAEASVLLSLFVFALNTAYWYSANKFRSMAYHALNRERTIAVSLNVQLPHPMIWGYYVGIWAFVTAYLLVAVILYLKILFPGLLPPARPGAP